MKEGKLLRNDTPTYNIILAFCECILTLIVPTCFTYTSWRLERNRPPLPGHLFNYHYRWPILNLLSCCVALKPHATTHPHAPYHEMIFFISDDAALPPIPAPLHSPDTSVQHFKLYETFLQLFQDYSLHPFNPSLRRPPTQLSFNYPSPSSSQTQNDDPFPSHIVNVFSFAHLPFSYVHRSEERKADNEKEENTESPIKYISINLYITFRQSYFLAKGRRRRRSFCERFSLHQERQVRQKETYYYSFCFYSLCHHLDPFSHTHSGPAPHPEPARPTEHKHFAEQ